MTGSSDVRGTIDVAARAHGVALGEAAPGWAVRGVPLAPFPARLRVDEEGGVVWHDVVAAEVVPPVQLEAVVEGIELPRPEVRLMVGEARWLVAISYPLPRERVRDSEVVGLLSAGPLYAHALALALWGHLGKRWRATLEEHGFVPGSGLPGDPRDLLRAGRIVPWPELAP